MSKKKIVIIVTVPVIIDTWLKGQAKYLSKYYDVVIITSYSDAIERISAYEGVEIKVMDLKPAVTPLKDIKVIYQMFMYFKKNKIDIVYTYTPKAGLTGMISACLARVPLRIHNIVGLPMMEARGLKLMMYKMTENITYMCANKLYSNSFGLREYINKTLTKKQINIVANGSVNGVDLDFFKDTFCDEEKSAIRETLGFKKTDFVLIFIGRIVKDKGVEELIESFKKLQNQYDDIKLLILGDYQLFLDPVSKETIEYIDTSKHVKRLEHKKDIRKYLSISDLLVLPSYREGLPNVLIEAGSFGLPLIATDINGCNEIVADGKNGLLIEPKSVDALYEAILEMYNDREKLNHFRKNARDMILSKYEQKAFWDEFRKTLV